MESRQEIAIPLRANDRTDQQRILERDKVITDTAKTTAQDSGGIYLKILLFLFGCAVGRHFLLWCIGIIALSWLGCGSGAAAIVSSSYLDPQTAELVRQAHRMADDLHGYHHYENDSSPYRKHCAAHDRYDELSVKFDMAVAIGDVFAARIIGDALADLGEEISYDEYLEDKYDDGYDSCFCRFVDYILGDHSAFVDVQFGYSGYRWVVEDFDGTKWGGILGVGGGFAIPLTQRFYGFVRVGAYETSDSKIDLFSPDSDFSARMQWLVTGEAGLGVPIFDKVGVRASAGFALADLKVVGPGGVSDGKTVPGYTIDGGIDIKLAPKWKLTLDTRYTQLQETNFSPLPAVNFAVSPKIWTTMIGVRYTFGNTAGNRLW